MSAERPKQLFDYIPDDYQKPFRLYIGDREFKFSHSAMAYLIADLTRVLEVYEVTVNPERIDRLIAAKNNLRKNLN